MPYFIYHHFAFRRLKYLSPRGMVLAKRACAGEKKVYHNLKAHAIDGGSKHTTGPPSETKPASLQCAKKAARKDGRRGGCSRARERRGWARGADAHSTRGTRRIVTLLEVALGFVQVSSRQSVE